jgi:hypothetical protein
MNVVMISPGYPAEMAFFARGLAAAGATVIGVGDQPAHAVPQPAREAWRITCTSARWPTGTR